MCVGSDCELLSRSWIVFFFLCASRLSRVYNGRCRIARMPRVTCGRATSAGTFIQPSRGRLLDVEAFLSHTVRFLYFTFCTLGSRLCNSFCMDHTLMSGQFQQLQRFVFCTQPPKLRLGFKTHC